MTNPLRVRPADHQPVDETARLLHMPFLQQVSKVPEILRQCRLFHGCADWLRGFYRGGASFSIHPVASMHTPRLLERDPFLTKRIIRESPPDRYPASNKGARISSSSAMARRMSAIWRSPEISRSMVSGPR